MRILLGLSQTQVVTTALQATGQSGPTVAAPSLAVVDVYHQHFDYVWHTLRRLGVSARELPDVTHDVFVTVHRRLHTFDTSRPVRPWLFGVALRVARDHLALARNRRELLGTEDNSVEPEDPSPAADAHLERAQQRALVQRALENLELDHRAVLILHDIEEQPMPEIAEVLGVPVKTLYSRLRVARETFTAAVRRLKLRQGEP